MGIVDSRGTWSDRYLNVVCIHFPAASPFARDDPRIRPLSRNAIGWRKEKEKIKFLGNSMATGGNKSRTLTTDNFSFWVEEQFREGGSLVTWHRALSFCSTPLFSNCTLHILFSIFKVSATRRLFQVLISRTLKFGQRGLKKSPSVCVCFEPEVRQTPLLYIDKNRLFGRLPGRGKRRATN